MIIIGVRFKDVGRIYYFDPGDFDPPRGSAVIVETVRGAEYGTVSLSRREADVSDLQQPIRKVLRLATPEDEAQEINNRQKEIDARATCIEKIKAHGLEMHLVDVELTFDLSKIIFYFTADGRVDFRELVKDLASTFRTRIELRQIGVRDEAKILNGIGICGRGICCASFLDEFQPVSVKIAKDQGLGLNPTKISGVCGKLMCCLKYEEETYAELNKGLPSVGDKVTTPDGDGEVLSVQVLRQSVKVAVKKKGQDAYETGFYPVQDIKILSHRPPCAQNCHCGACKKKAQA
ncbi:MAG: stage 0 sporulation family protein [Defluviitaleaceae bacterium]|nr:stage 0 sporulation family protein [Defluviitaleaceae bacterium]MCL2240579.1 stage 0 sporulation family protein [Defluviitaleaceae bacterium]